ncbi:hypothetical protein E1B28_003298 [Marasmius oreades]|uniref:Uncharacterized protein n=1 Tax=Marasmius oreades TaxID=181124 RepID=A0A9P7RLN9_9AGAR|nr:uncharacterized protein E1B28_003298 [Marasmius oreades]KAG7085755.1 hypothetical protein E1B28_003298 [Marasmius oreades]
MFHVRNGILGRRLDLHRSGQLSRLGSLLTPPPTQASRATPASGHLRAARTRSAEKSDVSVATHPVQRRAFNDTVERKCSTSCPVLPSIDYLWTPWGISSSLHKLGATNFRLGMRDH